MDFNFNCKRADVSANTQRSVSVSIEDVDMSDVLDHFTITDILKHFGEDKFLDEIGAEEAKFYFSIE